MIGAKMRRLAAVLEEIENAPIPIDPETRQARIDWQYRTEAALRAAGAAEAFASYNPDGKIFIHLEVRSDD